MENFNFAIRHQILESLKTGNPAADAILTMVAMSVVSYLVTKGGSTLSLLSSKLLMLFGRLWFKFKSWVVGSSKSSLEKKEAIIKEINMKNKSINEMYPVIYWYITNKVDLKKETPLMFSRDTTIEIDDNDDLVNDTINKELTYHKSKKFIFDGYEIEYYFDQKLETIYGSEKQVQKDNTEIHLVTYMDPTDTRDVLSDFCKLCMVEFAKQRDRGKWFQKIFINNGDRWTYQKSTNKRSISTLILKEGQKEKLLNDVKLFLESEQWYLERDIPWTRGYLLFGKPGTGKSSFIKAVSNMCERHIHYLALKEVKSDTQLINLLKDIQYDKTILVIEDIDCITDVVRDRQLKETEKKEDKEDKAAKSTKDKLGDKVLDKLVNKMMGEDMSEKKESTTELTLSGLLNCIDGVLNNHGRLLITTSNNPKVLDKALLRPGRIDVKEPLSFADHYQIEKLYENFYGSVCNKEDLYKIEEHKYSPAEITEVFLQNRFTPDLALGAVVDHTEVDLNV